MMFTRIRVNWFYGLIIIALIILSVMRVSMYRYGFFTAYDEAFFLLKMQEAYDGMITGASQWNLIAAHWFPFMDLTGKVNSCLAASILGWVTVLIYSITACTLYGWKNALKYFAICFLLLFNCIGGILCYVQMQTAVLCWAFCAFMLFAHSCVRWRKCLFALLCGLCLGLSIFIIIPAALFLLLCVCVLIIVMHWDNPKAMWMYMVSGLIGVLLSFAYVHFFVCNLVDVVDAMCFTASYIGKNGHGYDGISFVVRYGLFFRDCIFVLIAFLGAYFLSSLCKNKLFAGLLYISLLLIYTHYQVKPQVSSSMFFASVFAIPFFFAGIKSVDKWHVLRKKTTWLYLFMVAFPLIASLGTNTALSGRMTCFMVSWAFIWFAQEQWTWGKNWQYVRLGALVLFVLPLLSIIRNYQNRDDTYHFTRGRKDFAELAITQKQKAYFDSVYDIMEQYGFKPKQSVVFTAAFDYCSLYAFDGVNSSNFYQIENFHHFDKAKMKQPDFVFLCKWDSIVVAKELADMPWGWPDEFDEYAVGTPEDESAEWVLHPDLERRKLYCRKTLRKK